jgi:Tfp pilus assembly protein PilV
MRCAKRLAGAFALYEVLLGVAIFSVGVLVLGRSVENCLRATNLSAEDDRVRQILSNRMAEIQVSPGLPD